MANKMTEKNDFKSQNEGRTLNFVSDVDTAQNIEQEENYVVVEFTNTKGRCTNEDKLACAKKATYLVKDKNRHNYFIRQYALGEFKNQFYTPINGIETDFNVKTRNGGEPKYKWVKVNKAMFEIYSKYLITRNSVYMTQLNMEFTKNG